MRVTPKFLGVLAMLAATTSTADPWQDKAREILSRTVSLRTAEGHHQVPVMLDYLAGELRAGGFADGDIEIEPFGETATLVARYRGGRLNARPPVLLLAHADVVDADPADWELDPFLLTEQDGFLFGRGVKDNKFGIAMLTTTFLRLRAEGFVPDRDLIMVLTGDEETRQETSAMLAAREDLRRAEYALNTDSGGGRLGSDGEPTAYFVQTSEKTYATYRVTVRNAGGHSSRPRADNAVYELARALLRIGAYRFPVQTNDTTLGYMKAMSEVVPGDVGRALAALSADPAAAAAADTLAANPEVDSMLRTTCVATMLDAGHAENALAQRATATVNCRIFPDTDAATVQSTLAGLAGKGAAVDLVDKVYYAASSPLREDVFEAVGAALAESKPGVPLIPKMSAGYTDGSYFRVAGVPTYGVSSVFIRPEDYFAHGLNERVPVAALAEGLDFWQILLKQIAGN